MPTYLCATCGTSYPPAPAPPDRCPICEDERQFVPRTGQGWTTTEALAQSHGNSWRLLEPDLFEIRTRPDFAIGQRALLVRRPGGNILWDCIPLLDAATTALIRALGGLQAIAISHPHFHSNCQDWAETFGCPIHLHAANRDWVMRDSAAIRYWDGDSLALGEDVTLLRLGGHFPGGTVMHWKAGAEGAGALLSGDIVQVTPRAGLLSFMWSYSNLLPLSEATVRRIAAALEPVAFDRIYAAFPGREVPGAAKEALRRSAERYVALLNDTTL